MVLTVCYNIVSTKAACLCFIWSVSVVTRVSDVILRLGLFELRETPSGLQSPCRPQSSKSVLKVSTHGRVITVLMCMVSCASTSGNFKATRLLLSNLVDKEYEE